MKYIRKDTTGNVIETWSGQPSTLHTSNFYLLSHEAKLSLGWEAIPEEVVPEVEATLEELKDAYIARKREDASTKICNKFPVYKQINAALGIYSSEETTAIKSFIQDMRKEVHDYEAAIKQVTTKEGLDLVN